MISLDDIKMKDDNGEIDLKRFKSLVAELELNLNSCLSKLSIDTSTLSMSKQDNGSSSQVNPPLFNCPYNSQHKRISAKNYERHVNICRLKKRLYSNNEIREYLKQPEIESPYQIIIDENTQREILKPLKPHLIEEESRDVAVTNSALLSDYSSQERLALHNYAIAEAKKKRGFEEAIGSLNMSKLTPKLDNETSIDPATKRERIGRIRPRSYQTKNAKSQTQVFRELIQTQMEFLCQKEHTTKRERNRSRSRSKSPSNRKRFK